MTIESKNQLIDKLIFSIRTENIDAFDENTQKGIIWLGEKDVAKILNEYVDNFLAVSKAAFLFISSNCFSPSPTCCILK